MTNFEVGDVVFECQDLTYFYDVVIGEDGSYVASQWLKPGRQRRVQVAAFLSEVRSVEDQLPEEQAVEWCLKNRIANRIPHLEAQAREKNKQ